MVVIMLSRWYWSTLPQLSERKASGPMLIAVGEDGHCLVAGCVDCLILEVVLLHYSLTA
jgi:hypothetical protein